MATLNYQRVTQDFDRFLELLPASIPIQCISFALLSGFWKTKRIIITSFYSERINEEATKFDSALSHVIITWIASLTNDININSKSNLLSHHLIQTILSGELMVNQ